MERKDIKEYIESVVIDLNFISNTLIKGDYGRSAYALGRLTSDLKIAIKDLDDDEGEDGDKDAEEYKCLYDNEMNEGVLTMQEFSQAIEEFKEKRKCQSRCN